jgi:hypothetical protein
MLIFLINYIDLYSDLNPSNSKHILDALHHLLKELNIHNLFSPGGGGDGSGPYFFPLDTDNEKDFSSLVIKTNERSLIITHYNERNVSLYSDEVKVLSKRIDEYNKKLNYPEGKEMIKKKDKFLKRNIFLDDFFAHPYSLASLNMIDNNISN